MRSQSVAARSVPVEVRGPAYVEMIYLRGDFVYACRTDHVRPVDPVCSRLVTASEALSRVGSLHKPGVITPGSIHHRVSKLVLLIVLVVDLDDIFTADVGARHLKRRVVRNRF